MIVLSLPYLPNLKHKNSYDKLASYIEYRLDYHSDPFSLSGKFIGESTILTLRSVNEGGKYALSKQHKLDYYIDCIKKYNCLVDWELREYDRVSINPENLIISYHENVDNILNFTDLKNMLSDKKAKYFKIVLAVNSLKDLIHIHDLLMSINKPVLFCGTGRYGILSRILFRHLGAVGTFIGDDDHKTHSDQLTVREAELYRLNSISSETLLGGIIGGKQVYHSLGLEFFNRYFEEKHINARYLPLHLSCFEQIFNLLNSRPFAKKFYGFSVTMPFKQQLADRFISELPLNTFIPPEDRAKNTDMDGFERSLDYLQVAADDKILIIGSGATAISALFACKDHHIYITARNDLKAAQLASKYQAGYIRLQDAKKHFFDIVINCTPLGMQGENFMEETDIINFAKTIDLPYTSGDTPLITHCKASKKPYVDGKLFWQWQARSQLGYFLSAITSKQKFR